VEYDESYKGMNEVILDSENLEATARVEFQVDEGNFHRNPFWIDSLGHLSGFVMNANDSTPAGDVYVNHGWESMKCSRKFSSKKIYDTYVKMQPIGGNKYSGDVYVFEGEDIVAVYQGVTVS
jgi:naphtho-gamma-pyrone polyketide synthase